MLLSLAAARTAHAIPYETFVNVDDEGDLQDLLQAQAITQDTFDELLDLLDQGVDLSTADRDELYTLPNLTYDDVDKILAYRDAQNGLIKDPADLVAAGALTQEQLLGIAAFLIKSEAAPSAYIPTGYVKAMMRYGIGDKLLPATAILSRFKWGKHLSAGFAGELTRLEVGDPIYDPNRGALVADPRGYQLHARKAYVKYDDETVSAIVGSFRAGFGQRLVFDNSRHYTPNGFVADDQVYYSADFTSDCKFSAGDLPDSPCTGQAGNVYTTPDWNFRDGLFGVGGGLKKLELSTGWLQLYGWASASRRDIYQYELVDRAICSDPHMDADPKCAAPDVFEKPPGSDPLAPTAKFSFTTLPNVFREELVGTNATFFADRRNSVGITAYAANQQNLVGGIDLDFQEWSSKLTGRQYGAGGANFQFGKDWLDVFGEVALSADKLPKTTGPAQGGGGPAAILRATATRKKEELELSFRYLSTNYANPYSRPIDQLDVFDGQRSRDEIGGRLKYVRTGHTFNVRALLDVWVPPSSFRDDSAAGHVTPKIDTYVRTDVKTTDELHLGLWLRYQDKDLEQGGHNQCFETTTDTSPTGAPVPCSGRQLTTIARIAWAEDKDLSAQLLLEHQLLDDKTLDPMAFRQDVAAWVIAIYRPTPRIRLRARLRYYDEAFKDNRPGKAPNSYLETSASGAFDALIGVRKHDTLHVRFDVKDFLDNRASTLVRDPNPELTLWLSYEVHL